MKFKLLLIMLLAALRAAISAAAEPLAWERTPNRPAPAQFDTFHGETLAFSCTFTGFGALPFADASDVRLWYQTNGMGVAWWSVQATVSSNVLSAAWPPSADPGAGRVTFFFGSPSNAYAEAQVRFRSSPGAAPNRLDPPDVLDWLTELQAVSNALAGAIESVATNLPPGMTTNDVISIVTNEVTEFTEWTILRNGVDVTTQVVQPQWVGGVVNQWETRFSVLDADRDYFDSFTVGTEYSTTLTFDKLDWEADVSYTATRRRITRNAIGLARMSDVAPTVSNTVTKAYVEGLGIEAGISGGGVTNIVTNVVTKAYVEDLGIESGISAETATNIADTASAAAVANADTTYRRTIGLTNLNQSVQYANITDTTPTTLEIQLPTDGATKDWLVYVVSVTNVTLSLPAATWWMADTAYTNDVPPATPTAFWFSQVTDGIFILGRQDLTEVAIP